MTAVSIYRNSRVPFGAANHGAVALDSPARAPAGESSGRAARKRERQARRKGRATRSR